MRALSVLKLRKLLLTICKILCKDYLNFDEAFKEQQTRQTK
jgi:hypothetical protein